MIVEKTEVEIDFDLKKRTITFSGFETDDAMDSFMTALVDTGIIDNLEPVVMQ